MRKLKVLSLFAGIGGFDLGLERTGGFETVAFCEIEPYCQAVLKKHWPNVPIYSDVRDLTVGRLASDGIEPDVICGGFPCQDISVAGKGEGIEGKRSGLWSEYARLIGEIRPRFAIVENVSNLLGRGLDRVLGDLAALRFDAEWHCIPASAVGAPHRRDRIWIVANASGGRRGGPQRRQVELSRGTEAVRASEALADTHQGNGFGRRGTLQMGWGRFASEIANDGFCGRTQWCPEPDVGRVAHGISSRVDRLGALGNAVVPQIPEIIGRAILSAQEGARS